MKRDYAANSFNKGMIMDLNPLQMTDEAMTYCLNGTILTYNGNENALQCDMGNGRVETAVLPEGYIPMGTCSYGGIIYIVSYNPLKDLCQIGSFPSPERNIDSTELSSAIHDLSASDIVKKDVLIPSHKLELTTENLSPGDKFMVIAKDLDGTHLSDYENSDRTIGTFPKLWKMRLAAIEDSGKITYFDNVKWYDNKYYIKETDRYLETKEDLDVDSYRSIVSSAYTIFKSKSSGKLAIIVEPEMIDDFSCSYTLNSNDGVIFDIYLNVSWNTSDININPSWINVQSNRQISNGDSLFTKEDFVLNNSYNPASEISYTQFKEKESANAKTKYIIGEPSFGENPVFPRNFVEIYPLRTLYKIYKNGSPTRSYYRDTTHYNIVNNEQVGYTLNSGKYYKDIIFNNDNYLFDDIVNNEYDTDISIYIGQVKWSKDPLQLKITPYMPSGAMEHLSQTIKIDFNRVGTGEMSLDTWRYYQYSNTLLLNWGIDANPKSGEDVSKVVMTFYDNQGPTACYIADDYTSYNGKFLNYINLDRTSEYYDIGNVLNDGSIIKHIGKQIEIQDSELDNYKDSFDNYTILITSNNDPLNPEFVEYSDSINSSTHYFWENDSGILYKNILYLVKIDMYTSRRDTFTQTIGSPVTAWRWLWTNGIFNDYYDTELDFNGLRPELNLRVSAQYSGTLIPESDESNKISYTFSKDKLPLSERTGDVVQKLTNSYINIDTDLYFEDNYETFQIDADQVSNISRRYALMKDVDDRGNIKSNPEEPALIRGNSNNEIFTRSDKDKVIVTKNDLDFSQKPLPVTTNQEYISAFTNDSVVQDSVTWGTIQSMSDKFSTHVKINAKIHNPYFLSSDEDPTTSTVTTVRPFIKYESDLNKYNLQLLKKYNPKYVSPIDIRIAQYWNYVLKKNTSSQTNKLKAQIDTSSTGSGTEVDPSPSLDKDISNIVTNIQNEIIGSGGGAGGDDFTNKYGTITFRNALILGLGDNKNNSCFRGAYIAQVSKPYSIGSVRRIMHESLNEDAMFFSIGNWTKDSELVQNTQKLTPLFYPTIFMAYKAKNADDDNPEDKIKTFPSRFHAGEYQGLIDDGKILDINTTVYARYLPEHSENSDNTTKDGGNNDVKYDYTCYGGYIGCTTNEGACIDFLNRPVSAKSQYYTLKADQMFPWSDRSVINVTSEFVLGLLGQLYYKDNSEIREGFHYKYLNYFEDRIVSYIKDILYKPVINNKVTNTNQLLLIRGMKYSDYLSSITTKAKLLVDSVDYSNSNIQINQLVTNIPIILNFNITMPDIEDGVINCQRWDIEQGKYVEQRISLDFDSIGVYDGKDRMEDITELTNPLYFMEYVPGSIDREDGEKNTFCLKKIKRPIDADINSWAKKENNEYVFEHPKLDTYKDWKFSIQELAPYLKINEGKLSVSDNVDELSYSQNTINLYVSTEQGSNEPRSAMDLTCVTFFEDETLSKDKNVTLQEKWNEMRQATWNI